MISYMPEIYPDELIFSWFCRYYVHSGCITHKAALSDILFKRCNNPSIEFIGHLQADMLSLIQKMYSLEDLVLHHTMFPQYARFIPLEQRKQALYHMAYDFCDAHHLFSILPKNETDNALKYCPLCVKEDRQKYGEAYWHRIHQIRNMQICHKHGCYLHRSAVSAKSEQLFVFLPAQQYTDNISVNMASNPIEFNYSEYLANVFNAPMDFEKDIPIGAVMYYAMSKTPYMKKSGRTKYTKQLTEDIQTYFKHLNIPDTASMSQIQRLFLGERFDFSVVCQIGFYLNIPDNQFVNPSLTAKQIRQEKDIHYMRDKEPVDWTVFDEDTAPILERVAREIYDGTASETGRPERVSEKLIYRELDLPKHRLENLPKCKAIFDRYTETYPENWARRIVWAYNILKAEKNGTTFYWSDIRHLSGVKKERLDLIIPLLSKFADSKTVNDIIEIIA